MHFICSWHHSLNFFHDCNFFFTKKGFLSLTEESDNFHEAGNILFQEKSTVIIKKHIVYKHSNNEVIRAFKNHRFDDFFFNPFSSPSWTRYNRWICRKTLFLTALVWLLELWVLGRLCDRQFWFQWYHFSNCLL